MSYTDITARLHKLARFGVVTLVLVAGVPAAAAVRGRVVDSSGAPVVNARVEVVERATRRETRTDGDGRFLIEILSATATEMRVSAPGYLPASASVLSSEDAVTVQLARRPEEVVVVTAAARSPSPLAQTAESVSVLAAGELHDTPELTLDDKLRVLPGFNLFRRSSSRTANPTTQGVSLRGTGASGASRALVLNNGVPLNDPFGGWVYWNRVPVVAIDEAEILRGGASHLYGSGALGGVVSVASALRDGDAFEFDSAYGNLQTPFGSARVSTSLAHTDLTLAAEAYRSDGYFLVSRGERGRADTPAALRYGSGVLRIRRNIGARGYWFAGGSLFNESRNNGTALQLNSTRIADGSAGLSVQQGQHWFDVRGYGGAQRFVQTFSAISADRNSETLTRWDRVPAQQAGGSFQWRRSGTRHNPTAGLDLRYVRGSADGLVFSGGRATTRSIVAGRQRSFGLYARDSVALGSRVVVSAGARADQWNNYGASTASIPLNGTGGTSTALASRDDFALSPQASLLVRATSRLSFSGAAYGAFRAPTLQELYRGFRVGNVLTLANEQLRAERLTGVEAGASVALASSTTARAVFFWNDLRDPVANITLRTTPALITRQRQNLGKTRSRGLELEVTSQPAKWINLRGTYVFADSFVLLFPADPFLQGKRVPQVPRHQGSAAAILNFGQWTASSQLRTTGVQFDDDQNLLPLDAFATVDASVARAFGSRAQVYVAVENLFDQRYQVGRTPVVTLGPPILARVGVRLHFGEAKSRTPAP